MKRLVTVLMAVIMAASVFSLAGCRESSGGGGGNNGEDLGDLEGVTYVERSGEMYKDTKDGKTAIKISFAPGCGSAWLIQGARSFLLDEMGKQYYFVIKADAEITTSMSSKLESGTNLNDIYMPLASQWQSYASLGTLENLDSLYNSVVPGESKTVLEKIEGSWKTYGIATCKQEQHQYIFPWNENVTGLIYNEDMFKQYNWQIPTTVDEFDELCKKIVSDTGGKVAPIVYPGTVGGYWDFIGTNWWLQVSGVDKLNEFMRFESPEVYNPDDENSPAYGKLQMLKTFEKIIVKNKQTYTLRGSAAQDNLRAQISFGQGRAAMIPNGSWIEKESGKDIKFNMRMMPTPHMKGALKDDDGNYLNFNYSGQPDFMLIPSQAKNKEGAKQFLLFMCKDDMLKQYTENTGIPRPFSYNIDECKVTDFIKSTLDVWKNSTTWYEHSDSQLWIAGKAKKYQTTNPYTELLANSDTVSASGWAVAEYNAVKGAWNDWLKEVGLAPAN